MVAADVGFAEASWIMVVKSLVIFAVILGIVPMILLLERKLLGRFQHRFKVYGREGKPCAKKGCGGTVRRIVQGGRSTFYCPTCQR